MSEHSKQSKSVLKQWWFWIVVLLFVVIVVCIVYFSNNNTSQTNAKAQMTAEEIVNKLKEKGLNIGKIVVYTEETDLNALLGRPNQYTSKATFEDTRIEQVNNNNEFLTEEERNEPTRWYY